MSVIAVGVHHWPKVLSGAMLLYGFYLLSLSSLTLPLAGGFVLILLVGFVMSFSKKIAILATGLAISAGILGVLLGIIPAFMLGLIAVFAAIIAVNGKRLP